MKKIMLLILLLLSACAKIPEETGFIDIYFCPRNDCEKGLIKYVEEAKEVKCAFYDLDLEDLMKELDEINAEVLVYEDSHEGFGVSVSSKGLMHNKFCVLDGKIVMTGSFNPTKNGNNKNNNNMILIESETLAKNYLEEFEEIKKGSSKKTKKNAVMFNNALIENYFCPEDDCKKEVMEEICSAEESIHFMTFSFTDKEIAELLIEKSKEILVEGIMEKQRINMQYNLFHFLNNSNVEVTTDKNSGIMHHKVFIIDEKTVITGSYNPTKNANEKNDENIVIIHDKRVAEVYMEEFIRITNY